MKKNSLILLLFLIKFAYFQDDQNKIDCNTDTNIITIEKNRTAKHCNDMASSNGNEKCCYAKALLYGKKYHFCKYINKKSEYKNEKNTLKNIGYKHVDIDCSVKYLEKINKILLFSLILIN